MKPAKQFKTPAIKLIYGYYMDKRKIVDLFCGAGGLSSGFDNYFETILGNDNQDYMIDTFKHNFPNAISILGDITKINIKDELFKNGITQDEIFGVVGGPPCQGFSSVGNRMIDDPRNRLFKEFVKTVDQLQPNFFLMENVKGMQTMKNGFGELVINEIMDDFKNIGYNVASKLLPAINYGVPQKRERFIFLGYRKDLNKIPEFPTETHNEINTLNNNKYISLTVKDAISDLPILNPGESYENKDYSNIPNTEYQKMLRGKNKIIFNHKAPSHSEYMVERIKRVPQGGNHKDLPNEYKLKKGYSNIYGRLSWDKPADTITANCGCVSAPGRFIHPRDNRAITVREAARLQSFPDSFKFFGNLNFQYKQVGNAVPPLLAKNIAQKIYEDLK